MSHEQLPQGVSSRAVHGGERQQRLGDALTVPIYQTATYVFRDTQELIDFKEGRIDKGEYGRYGNPTVHAAERKLAELEHADEALLWASGMCAITSVLLTLLRPGQHMIITADSYRRTRQFCDSMLRRLGIEVAVVPPGDPQAVEAAVQPNTRLLGCTAASTACGSPGGTTATSMPKPPQHAIAELPRAPITVSSNDHVLARTQ